jgi:predicted nucleic acid-binding protein
MVDTNVVIYAMRMHRKDDDDLLVEMTTDSVAALRSLDVLVVSAVTVTEIMRGMRPDELERNEFQIRPLPIFAFCAKVCHYGEQ